VLLDRGFFKIPLQRLDIGSDVKRLNCDQLVERKALLCGVLRLRKEIGIGERPEAIPFGGHPSEGIRSRTVLVPKL
jgi:hypothetical protein